MYSRIILALSVWCFVAACPPDLQAQVSYQGRSERRTALSKGNNYDVLNIHFTYGAHLPGGDLKQRFGFHFSLGLHMDYITHPTNWIMGAETYYLFGGKVRENVLSNLLTYDGEIIGADNQFASIVMRERGMYTGLYGGKLIPLGKNPKEGLRLTAGAGYMWHKVRIQDDLESAPQISGEYIKGYDRLTGGFALNQFIGYQKLDRFRQVNFMAGLEFTQGFTNSIRYWNFDTNQPARGRRLDLAFGIRIAWTLPFYVGMPSEDIYY